MTEQRRASVLIIVVGLAMLLLTTFVVLTRQLRSDVDDAAIVLSEVQARAMLPAALSFILEAGRLGQHNDEEAFGWTDVRDGGVGPRGPRRSGGQLPPSPSAGRWPGPGSVYRADCFSWQQPPHAMRRTAAPNPIKAPEEWLENYEAAEDSSTTFLHQLLNPKVGNQGLGWVPSNPGNKPEHFWSTGSNPILFDEGLNYHWGRVWAECFKPMDDLEAGYHQGLALQPVADDIADFRSGDRRPRQDSMGRAWFRIYREQASDHNGDGSPWFDTMAIAGHGVFIISCGSGGTAGYRDWAEVTADGAGDRFDNDPYFFDELRAQERVLFYRVRWTGFVGGGGDVAYQMAPTDGSLFGVKKSYHNRRDYYTNIVTQRRFKLYGGRQYKNNHNPQHLLNNLGTIDWIERLEHEPTRGSQPGQGDSLW